MKFKIIISTLLVVSGVILFPSCQKELSCEGPACRGIYDDGKAVYTFVQNNGQCPNPFITGKYNKDAALEFDNAVVIKVDVSKPGTYTISTDTINGIYFKAVGSFSSTGVQPIVLYGIGKPIAAGSFTFTSSRASGCTFTIQIAPAIEYFFYDVTIDGVRSVLKIGEGAIVGNYKSDGPQVPLLAFLHNGRVQAHPDNTYSLYGLYVVKSFININNITSTGLQTFLQPGQYNYASRSSPDGITIVWVGVADGPWPFGTNDGDQTGSNFNITSVETYADTQGRSIARVKASFNCILYNRIGQSKVLTNGKFYGEFANILR